MSVWAWKENKSVSPQPQMAALKRLVCVIAQEVR